MMAQLFLHILDMSVTAGVVILLVMVIRLFIKKLPKVLTCALWGVAFFRLLCPFSFERPFSLLPARSQELFPDATQFSTGISIIDQNINQLISPESGSAAHLFHSAYWIPLVAWLWIAGMILLLLYNLITLVRLQKKLVGAVRVHANVYFADEIVTPFVIGIIRPRIYLPSDISTEDQRFVETHEKMHIRYAHHIIKLIAFSALVLHWFNPLVWAAFVLFCKDMEMMCDEGVLRHMNGDVRRQYSKAILHFAANKRMMTVLPVAFGEGDTKTRIKNILAYHKSAFGTVGAATVFLIMISLCLLSDGPSNASKYIQFPAYQAEDIMPQVPDNAVPFRMYLDLPEGWEVHMPPEGENDSWFVTPVYLYKDDALMAICGYNQFESIDENEIPQEDYYKAVYSGIRLGSLYRWDDYQPIVTSEYMETALANVYIEQTDGMTAAAASPTIVMPGILSYNKQLQVYVAVQFLSDTVTNEEQETIAKSIHLS